jgi:hypothetical protein
MPTRNCVEPLSSLGVVALLSSSYSFTSGSMGREKGAVWDAVVYLQNDSNKVECLYCGAQFAANASRIRGHLVGGCGDVRKCTKMTAAVRSACALAESAPSVSTTSAGTRVAPSIAKKRNRDIRGMLVTSKEDPACDAAIAECIFGCGFPPSIARSNYFKGMAEAIQYASLNYQPPGSEKLRTTLLANAVKSCQNAVKALYQQHDQTGCTLCSDEWTNIHHQSIINSMLVSPQGAAFHSFDECSAQTKSADDMAEKLIEVIEEVGMDTHTGKPRVVQVCTFKCTLILSLFP